MAEDRRVDRLDDLVEAILAGRPVPSGMAAEIAALGGVGRILMELPAERFRERLGADLAAAARRYLKEGRPEMEILESVKAKLTPYLVVRGGAGAIDFYRRAFGAEEKMRLEEPGGRIGHAELSIGGASFMLADEYPEYGILGPQSLGGASSILSLAIDDVDAVFARAVAQGARVVSPVKDEFYGDRAGKLADPFGHVWAVSSQRESVSPAEMQKRFDSVVTGSKPGGEPAGQGRSLPPVRPGFHAVTPYLQVRAAEKLIDFVKEAFGATETFRTIGSAGGTHAEVRIGDSMVMIGGVDEPSFQEIPAAIYLYVPDVDATYAQAVRAGAVAMQPPTNQPYGDRNAFVKDPFGNTWYLATHGARG